MTVLHYTTWSATTRRKTRPTKKITRTAKTITAVGTVVSKAPQTTRKSWRLEKDKSATYSPHCFYLRVYPCSWLGTNAVDHKGVATIRIDKRMNLAAFRGV